MSNDAIIETLVADLDNYHTALRQLKAIHERAPLAHENDGLIELVADLAGSIARVEMKIVQAQSLKSWSMTAPPMPGANASTNGGR